MTVAFARGIQLVAKLRERIRVIVARDRDPAATCLAQLTRHARASIMRVN